MATADLGWRTAWCALPETAQVALTAVGLGEPTTWAHLLDGTEDFEIELLEIVESLTANVLPEFKWHELLHELMQLEAVLRADTRLKERQVVNVKLGAFTRVEGSDDLESVKAVQSGHAVFSAEGLQLVRSADEDGTGWQRCIDE